MIHKSHTVIYHFKENLILYKIDRFSIRFTFEYIELINNLRMTPQNCDLSLFKKF